MSVETTPVVVKAPAPLPLSEAEKKTLAKQEQDEKIDALRHRVKTLRERAMFERSAVRNPEPGKVYCWVNVREERQISYQAYEWAICTEPDKTSYWKESEGRHRRADLILYEMDTELYEAIQADNISRGVSAGEEDIENQFNTAVRQLGGRTYEPKARR